MRLERLGAAASTCLGSISCTGSCDLLGSKAVGCSTFIGGIDGSIRACRDVGSDMSAGGCWCLVA